MGVDPGTVDLSSWDAVLAQAPGRVERIDAGDMPLMRCDMESITERRAWELFRDAVNRGVHVGYSLREAFAYAEAFAAEAKRRASK